jgi:hypothetical protein
MFLLVIDGIFSAWQAVSLFIPRALQGRYDGTFVPCRRFIGESRTKPLFAGPAN